MLIQNSSFLGFGSSVFFPIPRHEGPAFGSRQRTPRYQRLRASPMEDRRGFRICTCCGIELGQEGSGPGGRMAKPQAPESAPAVSVHPAFCRKGRIRSSAGRGHRRIASRPGFRRCGGRQGSDPATPGAAWLPRRPGPATPRAWR